MRYVELIVQQLFGTLFILAWLSSGAMMTTLSVEWVNAPVIAGVLLTSLVLLLV